MEPHPIVTTVRELQPLIRQHLIEGEQSARLTKEVVTAVGQAGFFRLCAPYEVGGLEVSPLVVLAVTEAVSTADPAVTTLRKFLTRNLNILHAQLVLAIASGELGREEEAKATAAEVLRINPKFSLEVYKERVPIKDPATLEREIAALRKAGLK